MPKTPVRGHLRNLKDKTTKVTRHQREIPGSRISGSEEAAMGGSSEEVPLPVDPNERQGYWHGAIYADELTTIEGAAIREGFMDPTTGEMDESTARIVPKKKRSGKTYYELEVWRSTEFVGKIPDRVQEAIHYKVTKGGQKRAYRYSRSQMRWFPIPMKEADSLFMAQDAYISPHMEKDFIP